MILGLPLLKIPILHDIYLKNDVHEVQDLAEEELGRPDLVLQGVLGPSLHVGCQLVNFGLKTKDILGTKVAN